jgi:NADH-quinone oxidoreductase subunit C
MFTTNNELIDTLNSKLAIRFGDAVLAYEMAGDMPQFTVKKEIMGELLQFLYDDKALEFKFLTDICGAHYPEAEQPFAVIYHLHNLPKNQRVRIKAFASENDLAFPTATRVFSAANWMERETYDFFGIQFDGHPNLKRILNVDDMDYFPLRKQYPLEDATREDKDDSMFGR